MSFTISVTGTLFSLKCLLWGTHLCSSGLTWGESVCQTQPYMIDRAIYPNIGRKHTHNTLTYRCTHGHTLRDLLMQATAIKHVCFTCKFIKKPPQAMKYEDVLFSAVCLLRVGHWGAHTITLQAAVRNTNTYTNATAEHAHVCLCAHIWLYALCVCVHACVSLQCVPVCAREQYLHCVKWQREGI